MKKLNKQFLKLPTEKFPDADDFTVEFYQTFKEIIANLHKLFQNVEENTFQISL